MYGIITIIKYVSFKLIHYVINLDVLLLEYFVKSRVFIDLKKLINNQRTQ